MISKRVYLLLTAVLLLISIGASFAGQSQKSRRLAALQALQTASMQLNRLESKTAKQAEAEALIDHAIKTLSSDELGTPASPSAHSWKRGSNVLGSSLFRRLHAFPKGNQDNG